MCCLKDKITSMLLSSDVEMADLGMRLMKDNLTPEECVELVTPIIATRHSRVATWWNVSNIKVLPIPGGYIVRGRHYLNYCTEDDIRFNEYQMMEYEY